MRSRGKLLIVELRNRVFLQVLQGLSRLVKGADGDAHFQFVSASLWRIKSKHARIDRQKIFRRARFIRRNRLGHHQDRRSSQRIFTSCPLQTRIGRLHSFCGFALYIV